MLPTDLLADAMTEDDRLCQRVCLYLQHSGHAPVRRLDVGVADGVVTLRGNAPNYYTRQLALACAHRVAGVRQVIDEIEVLPFDR